MVEEAQTEPATPNAPREPAIYFCARGFLVPGHALVLIDNGEHCVAFHAYPRGTLPRERSDNPRGRFDMEDLERRKDLLGWKGEYLVEYFEKPLDAGFERALRLPLTREKADGLMQSVKTQSTGSFNYANFPHSKSDNCVTIAAKTMAEAGYDIHALLGVSPKLYTSALPGTYQRAMKKHMQSRDAVEVRADPEAGAPPVKIYAADDVASGAAFIDAKALYRFRHCQNGQELSNEALEGLLRSGTQMGDNLGSAGRA